MKTITNQFIPQLIATAAMLILLVVLLFQAGLLQISSTFLLLAFPIADIFLFARISRGVHNGLLLAVYFGLTSSMCTAAVFSVHHWPGRDFFGFATVSFLLLTFIVLLVRHQKFKEDKEKTRSIKQIAIRTYLLFLIASFGFLQG